MSTPYYIILDTDGAFKEALLAAGTGVTLDYDPTTRTTTIASIDLATINSISNPGGNIDLVAGSGISITPDSTAKTITITNTGGGGGGGVTSLNTLTGAVTLAAGTNVSLSVVGSTITINAVDNFATLNSVSPDGSNNIDLTGGTNITITPNAGAHTVGVGLSGQVAVANGGTGASTASAALTNLGATGSLNTATPDPATNSIGLASSTLTVTNSAHSVAVEIGSNSITDAEIGNRTVNQALATPGNTGLLTSLLSWLAGAIKAIKGTTNWYDTPATDLATTNTHITSTSNPHSTTAAQVGAIATVNSITPSGTDFAVTAADSSITIGSATHGITVKANNSGVGSINGLTGTPSVVAGANISVTTSSPNITVAVSPQGTGSGLDADKLDGIHATGFLKVQTSSGAYALQSGVTAIGSSDANWTMYTTNSNGVALEGEATGNGNTGIWGYYSPSTGNPGIGVLGTATKGVGVRGEGTTTVGVEAYNGSSLQQLRVVADTGSTVPGSGVSGDIYVAANGLMYLYTRGGFSIISRSRATSFPVSPQANERVYRTDFKAEFEWNGSAWEQLSVGDFTSFPGSPTTNLRVFRTDRGLEYYYDGTRWLTTVLHKIPVMFPAGFTLPMSTSPVTGGRVDNPEDTQDIYLEKLTVSFYTDPGTYDAANYWKYQLYRVPTSGQVQIGTDQSTWATGRVVSVRYSNTFTINTQFTAAQAPAFRLDWAKVGSPSTGEPNPAWLHMRFVG